MLGYFKNNNRQCIELVHVYTIYLLLYNIFKIIFCIIFVLVLLLEIIIISQILLIEYWKQCYLMRVVRRSRFQTRWRTYLRGNCEFAPFSHENSLKTFASEVLCGRKCFFSTEPILIIL